MNTQRRMRPGMRILLKFVIPAVIIVFGARWAMAKGWIPSPSFMKSTVVASSTRLADNNDAVDPRLASSVAKINLPSTRVVSVPGPEIRFEHWFWNAHLSCDLANGGPLPTQGSLTAKYGVNLRLVWNDVTPKMQENLLAFATALSNGSPQPSIGAHFVSIMGDQAAGFLGPINNQLKKLGPEYIAEIVYSCGRSNGEDQFMGPAEWKANPRNAIGGLVSTVVREGDWNIVIKWAADNNIPVNPDDKTYDPDALNFFNAADNPDAGQKFVSGYCENRPVVQNGKLIGKEQNVCINAVSVWTPVDVSVAENRGGLVRLVSTKEYAGQMPVTVIGIRKWNQDNRQSVVNMIRAFGEAGDQVLAYEDAQLRAAQASSAVYNGDKSPEWILRYYHGVEQKDAKGILVPLGGSRVHNLADNFRWFGLNGNSNMFAATYTVFGDIVKELYPDLLPSYPQLSEVLNTSYLEEAARLSTLTVAEAPVYTGGAVRDVVSSGVRYITFKTSSASFTPQAERELERLYNDLLVSSDLAISIAGHTDNTGTFEGNQSLSESRAFAVKSWLQARAPRDFPDSRIRIEAYGQTKPIAPNSTEDGRARNRRVEIIQGRQ